MTYSATVLADSLSPDGDRLTTVEVTFPRFILAEVNTHCMLSRNSASSRAIPPEKMIEAALEHPFVPETFNARVRGMGVGSTLEGPEAQQSRLTWLLARDAAVEYARDLINLGVDKSRINRLLEPFLWHTAIITATEWDNFFALRCPPGDDVDPGFPAQLEFQYTALEMRRVMKASLPHQLGYGDWHLPLVDADDCQSQMLSILRDHYDSDDHGIMDGLAMVSAGRCARSSYMTHHDPETMLRSFTRAKELCGAGHMSPFEHPARPVRADNDNDRQYCLTDDAGELWGGKLRGWLPMRKFLPCEGNFGATHGRGEWDR